MQVRECEAACELIAAAMNTDEARWARQTFDFHFKCKHHGLDDGRIYFTHHAGSHISALAGLHHYAWGPDENVWLAWFAVHPDYQRQGLGSQMLAFIEARARARGFRKLFVETYMHADFDKARSFYEASGFQPAGGINSYLPGNEDMIVYAKVLT
jgi:GNAT superfamily N-acetyltransferase